jgi:hypothetical protein
VSAHTRLAACEQKDKLEGMKRLMAMISIGRDASNFFPDVVKQVISDSLEVKKLAYQFLTHYAEAKSNEALLCINTFQKDLNDTNQLIRSSALRVLTSIRVPIIAQLQTMAVKQCVRDSSAYVRKAAAHAVAKVHALDPEQSEALYELVQVLLQDNSTMVRWVLLCQGACDGRKSLHDGHEEGAREQRACMHACLAFVPFSHACLVLFLVCTHVCAHAHAQHNTQHITHTHSLSLSLFLSLSLSHTHIHTITQSHTQVLGSAVAAYTEVTDALGFRV